MDKLRFNFSSFLLLLLFLVFPDQLRSDAGKNLNLVPSASGENVTEIKVIDVPDLENLISNVESEIRVINFWATWCKPCIEELPYFEKVNTDPQFDHVEVILISLDFIEDLESKVKNFVEKKDIQSRVMLLDNTDYNSWIDKVDPSWSGAIPATLILETDSGQRKFIEKALEEGELEKILTEF